MNFGKWVSVRLVRTLLVENWHALGVYSHFLLSQVNVQEGPVHQPNVTHQRNTLMCGVDAAAATCDINGRKNPCTVQEVLAEWFSPAGEGCRARVRPPLYLATTFMSILLAGGTRARAARWE
jgi:hypothetical protein